MSDDVRRAFGYRGSLPDPAATPVGPQSKQRSQLDVAGIAERLDPLQNRFWGEARGGGARRVLFVLQGMDTSGKGGAVRTVFGLVNPHGVRVCGFGRPSAEEARHHFLWRIRRELPRPGEIGVFDRSHYEDVIVPTVQGTLTGADLQRRFAEINAFERQLTATGTTVVKVFLHISAGEQLRRLRSRLTEPSKRWKYDPSDRESRARWGDFQRAYHDVFERTSTSGAPWYVVPADHKWYRTWAVASLLLATLEELDPEPPPPSFDVAAELAALDALGDVAG